MQYLGDFVSGSTIRGSFNTRTAAGTPITLGGTPALSVYKDGGTTETTTGVTLTVDFDSRTGHHLFAIVTSDAFYTTGSDFRVVITTGTVDGTSVVGTEVGSFSIQNRSVATVASQVAAIETDTQDIQSRIPAALVSGRMDSSVGAMAANTLTASALATDAVAEIQTGLSTLDAAGVRAAVGLASANLDSQLSTLDATADAIQAKTDNLPSDPADQSAVETAITNATSPLATKAQANAILGSV